MDGDGLSWILCFFTTSISYLLLLDHNSSPHCHCETLWSSRCNIPHPPQMLRYNHWVGIFWEKSPIVLTCSPLWEPLVARWQQRLCVFYLPLWQSLGHHKIQEIFVEWINETDQGKETKEEEFKKWGLNQLTSCFIFH